MSDLLFSSSDGPRSSVRIIAKRREDGTWEFGENLTDDDVRQFVEVYNAGGWAP